MSTEQMTAEQIEAADQAAWDAEDEVDAGSPDVGGNLAQVLTTDAPDQAAADEAAANALFDGEQSESSADDTTSAPTQDAAATPPPQAAVDPVIDPIAQLNATVAQLAQTIQQNQRAMDGKIGGLTNHLTKVQERQAEAAAASLAQAPSGPSQAAIDEAAKNDAEWVKLKADFPEWGDGIEKFVAKQVAAATKSTAPAVDIEALIKKSVETLVPQQVQTVLQAQKAEQQRLDQIINTIEAAHPKWLQTVNSAPFVQWQNTLAPGLRALADSENPQDAIALLNMYAAARPSTGAAPVKDADQVRAERAERLKASATPSRVVNTGPRTAVAVDDMSDDEYWAYLDRQDAQKAQRVAR